MKVPKYWKSKELLDATAREGDARRKLLEAKERKHALEQRDIGKTMGIVFDETIVVTERRGGKKVRGVVRTFNAPEYGWITVSVLKKDGTPSASTQNWYYDWEKE